LSLEKNTIIIFFLALCGLFITTAAIAETTLNPSLAINERFETNPLHASRGQKNDDFITTITPEISLTQSWKTLKITGMYHAGIEIFAQSDENNQVAHFAALLMTASLGKKTELKAGDEASRSENVFDIAAVAAGNVQIKRTTTIYNHLYVGIKHDISERLAVNILAEDSDLEFDDPAQIDTRTESVSTGFDYALKGTWKTGSTYRYDRFSFNREDLGNAELHFLSLRLAGKPYPTLTLNLSGGGVYSQDTDSKANWIADGSITKEFKKLALTANYSRTITQSVGLTNDVTIGNVVSATITSDLTDKLGLIITGNYGKSRSELNSTLDTKSYGGGISGAYKFRPWASLDFGYTYFKQLAADSSAANDILDNSVFLNLILTPRELKI